MAKRKQTIPWLKENRQCNGEKKTDNTMAKGKQTIVCFPLAILMSVFF
jgi:hypothetical protein